MMKLMKYIKGLVIVGAVLSGVMMTSCEDNLISMKLQMGFLQ